MDAKVPRNSIIWVFSKFLNLLLLFFRSLYVNILISVNVFLRNNSFYISLKIVTAYCPIKHVSAYTWNNTTILNCKKRCIFFLLAQLSSGSFTSKCIWEFIAHYSYLSYFQLWEGMKKAYYKIFMSYVNLLIQLVTKKKRPFKVLM